MVCIIMYCLMFDRLHLENYYLQGDHHTNFHSNSEIAINVALVIQV